MLSRYNYSIIKKEIKEMCKASLDELCDKINITEYDKKLLLCINKNMSRVATSIELGCCEWKVSNDLRKIFKKIYDYKKRTND